MVKIPTGLNSLKSQQSSISQQQEIIPVRVRFVSLNGDDYPINDWSTKIRWSKEKKLKPLLAQLSWDTLDDTMAGQYRMKHTGFVALSDGSTKPFDATSDTFTIR